MSSLRFIADLSLKSTVLNLPASDNTDNLCYSNTNGTARAQYKFWDGIIERISAMYLCTDARGFETNQVSIWPYAQPTLIKEISACLCW